MCLISNRTFSYISEICQKNCFTFFPFNVTFKVECPQHVSFFIYLFVIPYVSMNIKKTKRRSASWGGVKPNPAPPTLRESESRGWGQT